MSEFSITAVPIDCTQFSASMKADAAGGFVSFEGWVRNHNEGLSVSALEYEVFHGLALSEGKKILGEAIELFQLIDASAVHREGVLAIGDCAVWIGVTAQHRGNAFAGCRYIIDEMKHRLPIWKREQYEAVAPQWVNCQHHNHTPQISVTKEEFYSRQMLLPEIGAKGQELLGSARALIVGVGGLGSSAALALAAAGIGTIGLADHDKLSASNLHRQHIYNASDVGRPKTALAASRLKSLNPLIEIKTHSEKVTAENIKTLFFEYDIILDCTDNFTAKYLLNDAAILYKKPVVQASVYRFEGQLLTIDAGSKAGCLRCIFPEPPLPGMIGDCVTTGVLGTVPMLFGTLQANEAIKKILSLEFSNDLLTFDLLSLRSQKLQRRRRADCILCGHRPTLYEPEPVLDFIVQTNDTMEEVRSRFVVIDVREAWEIAAVPFGDSVHLPTSAFDAAKLDISKDKPLLVVCTHGARSLAAVRQLREMGWQNAYSLSGGIELLPKSFY